MGRVSQAQAAENRRRIVAAAARLFRERGIGEVSVTDVMAEAGLTHGGFYKHFASKEALVAEAVALAFAKQAERGTLGGRGTLDSDAEQVVRGAEAGLSAPLIDDYLSVEHRDDPGGGCPTAGFGGDVAKDLGGNAARVAYADGVEGFARAISGGGEPDLAALSTMVGALILARATAGTDLSERILAAARDTLNPATGEGRAESEPSGPVRDEREAS